MITCKNKSARFDSPHGETIYELLGQASSGGKNYSFAEAELAPQCASQMHYHPSIEECYYILSGIGEMRLDEKSQPIAAGDCIAITPNTCHKIINTGDEILRFVVLCVPAWTPDCSVFLE